MVCTLSERRDSLVRVDLGSDPASTAGSTSLTDGYTGDLDPDFSRSGDRLVFSSTRSGQRNLWIAQRFNRSRPLISGFSLDEYPQFLPDGQHVDLFRIAAVNVASGLSYRMRVSPQRVLAAAVLLDFSRSPDGREIVFSTPVGELPGLSVINVVDGHTRCLQTNPGRYLTSMVTDRRRDCRLGT